MRNDERLTIFARTDLKSGTLEYEQFYKTHPELKSIDDEIRTYSGLGSKMPISDYWMFYSLGKLIYFLGSPDKVEGVPSNKITRLSPERASQKIKGFARQLGADLCGISLLKPEFVYSHHGRICYPSEPTGKPINLTHQNAISLGFKMDPHMVRSGPRHGSMVETGIMYYISCIVSIALAEYIRSLGYAARAHHMRNYQVLPVPLAVEAGLGELGRCGFLLTKEHGNCLRLATVTTDMPMSCDSPVDIGVQDFCRMCKLCAEVCPSQAIPFGEKVLVDGVKKWQLDAEKCYKYWRKMSTDCGMCIGSCPWSLPDSWYHRISTEWATKSHIARKVLLWLYPVFYGKYKPQPLADWLEN